MLVVIAFIIAKIIDLNGVPLSPVIYAHGGDRKSKISGTYIETRPPT